MSVRTLRVEDHRLLTDAGRYTADLSRAGQLHGVFLRSPHAHAVLTTIDTAAALAQPGVVAILTGGDVRESGFGMMPAAPVVSPSGRKLLVPQYPALAQDPSSTRWRRSASPISTTCPRRRSASGRRWRRHGTAEAEHECPMSIGGPA